MEIVNGYTVVARKGVHLLGMGSTLILAVRESPYGGFEYVTAWHVPGDSHWVSGHYTHVAANAFADFLGRE
jgi:hypothetical protein